MNDTACETFTAFIGWESMDAHNAAKELPPFQANIHYLKHAGNAGLRMRLEHMLEARLQVMPDILTISSSPRAYLTSFMTSFIL
jgi:hypothetical protein